MDKGKAIYEDGRIVERGRKLILRLGDDDRRAQAFTRLDGELCAASG